MQRSSWSPDAVADRVANPKKVSGLDYIRYYDLEDYVFAIVGPRFLRAGHLCAFDFFSIIRWKSERAKRRIADGLRAGPHPDLDKAVGALTGEISRAANGRVRFEILIARRGIGLSMATAILTVLYPEEFTVYDVRACNVLNDYWNIGNSTTTDKIWKEYVRFREAVRQNTPRQLSLRDKDRWLWGQDVAEQLKRDIDNGFKRREG